MKPFNNFWMISITICSIVPKHFSRKETYTIANYDDFVEKMRTNPGFAKGMWCGNQEQDCEDRIRRHTPQMFQLLSGASPEQEDLGPVCHLKAGKTHGRSRQGILGADWNLISNEAQGKIAALGKHLS